MTDNLERIKSQILLLNDLCQDPVSLEVKSDAITILELVTAQLDKEKSLPGVLTAEEHSIEGQSGNDQTTSTEELRQLIDNTPAITYASVASGDFRITYINQTIKKILGHEVSEVLEEADFWFDHIHPDDRMEMFSRLPFLWEEKKQHYDLRFKKKDGSYLWMHNTLQIITDEETGEASLIIGSLTDISKRVEFEEQLKEREQSYRLMLEGSLVIPWEMELPSMIPTYIGPQVEKVFGMSQESCTQESFWLDHLHPDDKKATLNYFSDIEELTNEQEIEYRMLKGDGETIWIRDLFSISENDKKNKCMHGVMIDITEQKLLEASLKEEKNEQEKLISELKSAQAQLLQSEKMASIGNLAAGVAHEINNPIGFINSNIGSLKEYVEQLLTLISKYSNFENTIDSDSNILKLIKDYKQDIEIEFIEEDIISLLEESAEGLERVKNIVIDLKTFSHMDRAEWETVDLHKGLDSTLNVAHNEIKFKAEVTKAYGELPPIECMPSQVNQVFMNTLVNAAQAIEDFGKIHITSRHVDDMVCITIKDSGKGIKEKDMKHLFDPFFTTKPVGEGTGLGLSLSYGIVEDHHGKIEVQSTVGEGTEFQIWLPVSQEKFSEEKKAIDTEPMEVMVKT